MPSTLIDWIGWALCDWSLLVSSPSFLQTQRIKACAFKQHIMRGCEMYVRWFAHQFSAVWCCSFLQYVIVLPCCLHSVQHSSPIWRFLFFVCSRCCVLEADVDSRRGISPTPGAGSKRLSAPLHVGICVESIVLAGFSESGTCNSSRVSWSFSISIGSMSWAKKQSTNEECECLEALYRLVRVHEGN